MNNLTFYKLQASGNDFILLDQRASSGRRRLNYRKLSRRLCARKFGIGADGLLVVESSPKADFKMRIINSDGSEAEMCGNGARCVALWADLKSHFKARVKFETQAGIIEAIIPKGLNWQKNIKINTSSPGGLKLDLLTRVLGRTLRVNYIDTGVPHAVVLVQGLEQIDVARIGRELRFHKRFRPGGTNVDFVEVIEDGLVAVRTYERGVEAETLACGTGAIASAIIAVRTQGAIKQKRKNCLKVKVRSGEILKVYFDMEHNICRNVWLEGKAALVYQGATAT